MVYDGSVANESEHQRQFALLLHFVACKRPVVFELFASEDDALLVNWQTRLSLDLELECLNCSGVVDAINGVGLSVQVDDVDFHC